MKNNAIVIIALALKEKAPFAKSFTAVSAASVIILSISRSKLLPKFSSESSATLIMEENKVAQNEK